MTESEYTTFSDENLQELREFVLSWLDSQKNEFNQSVKLKLLQEALEDRFQFDMESAYMIADQALNLTPDQIQSLASPGKARNSEIVGKTPIDENLASEQQEVQKGNLCEDCSKEEVSYSCERCDKKLCHLCFEVTWDNKDLCKACYEKIKGEENLASTPQDSTYTPIGKTPISTLNFQHDYFKLKNDEFTTIRGKSLYYKNFTVNGQKRKIQKGDTIRTTKHKDFFYDTVVNNVELKRIENIPLEVLKRDGEYPGFTINSIEDFVNLINSFLPKHYSKATPESYKTLLTLKKSLTADPRVNKNLASPGKARTSEIVGKKSIDENLASTDIIGKNDIQEESRQESLASHPIVSDPEGKNVGKIMSLVNVDKSLASQFNPGSGAPSYKVVKKGTEFYISANIQGLVKKTKKCNKKGCRCLNGKEHGPYYYLYIKDPNTGTRREIYFGRAPA